MSEVGWKQIYENTKESKSLADYLDKKFLDWHIVKQKIDKSNNNLFFKERDVFFISMGENIGREQNGKGDFFARPVVIIRKFNNNIFRWVSLTTKIKEWKYYFTFELQTNKWQRTAILSQMRLYDKNRLINKIGTISEKDFLFLQKKLSVILHQA